jgi:hypothetical protein
VVGADVQGEKVSYEEVEAACLLDARGAILELALQGLREAGWEIDVVEEFDIDEVSAALSDGRPLITTVLSRGEPNRMAHAVVVCAVTGAELTVMDPLVGDYRIRWRR